MKKNGDKVAESEWTKTRTLSPHAPQHYYHSLATSERITYAWEWGFKVVTLNGTLQMKKVGNWT